jgi:ribosomal protein S27AE
MAEKRTCPSCGRTWWSADSANDWVCECGATIPKESEVK